MSTAAPARSANDATSKNKSLVPPDEKFWKRYSPHYEFPLSSISSFALHVLILGLAALFAMIVFPLFAQPRMELDEVSLADAGGGGDPDALGFGPGAGASGEATEQQKLPDPTTRFEKEKVEAPDLSKNSAAVALNLPDVPDEDLRRVIEENNKAVQSIKDLPKTTREKLTEGLAAGKGQGGSGSGGGKGPGKGPGEGPGTGPGKANISKRIQRMLRWTMEFNTRDGNDYARQLQSIGAVLAVESPEDPQKGIVYEVLTSPAKGEARDLNSFNRIWWIDDRPESISALARALSISPTPRRFIAFLPQELEQKLLDLELNYKGAKEEDIKETVFQLRRTLEGRYEPRVRSQR